MKSEIIKQEATVVEIKLTFPKEELTEQLEKAYKSISQKANIKGFRKGKVPRPMLEKFYPKQSILPEVAEEMLSPAMQETIEEYDLVLVSDPKIQLEKLELGSDFVVNVTFTVEPDFEFPNLSDIKVTKHVVKVTDEAVEKELKRLAETYTKLTPTKEYRPLVAGDSVSIKYTSEIFYNDGTSHKVNREFHNEVNLAEGNLSKEFIDSLIGKKPGEKAIVEVTYKKALASFGGKRKIVKSAYNVEVVAILKEEPQELNDDFAKDYSNSDVETIDELRSVLKQEMEHLMNDMSQALLEDDVLDLLLNAVEFELPEVILSQEKERIIKDQELKCKTENLTQKEFLKKINLTKDENDSAIENEAKRLTKLCVIISRFARDNNISLAEDDFKNKVMETSLKTGFSPQQVIDYLKKDSNILEAFKDEAFTSKVRAILASKVNVTIKEVTEEEFKTLQKAKHAPSDAKAKQKKENTEPNESATKQQAPTKSKLAKSQTTTVKKPRTSTAKKAKPQAQTASEQLSLNLESEDGEKK